MKPVVITEYERFYYADDGNTEYRQGSGWHVPRRLLERLQAFDNAYALKHRGVTVFDWSARGYVKATNHVGVIQVPGLMVEILPKIDTPASRAENERLAQENLLYMLAFTRRVPLLERDLASLSRQNMPLLDALISIFVERLITELLRGLDHAYVHREENLTCLKGKLLIPQQISRNAVHRERAFVGYDDFVADTWLNRIIKAACRRLPGMTSLSHLQKRLRETLTLLDDVSEREIGRHDFDRVHLTRNNERFRPLLEFCRLVLCDESPTAAMGKRQTFSLLFPMEKLFEEFIAAFICRHAAYFGLERACIHVQARGREKPLLLRDDGSHRFRLKPDIVIERSPHEVQLIIDTKWKHLKTSDEDVNNGVAQSDIYQLYAYSHRYHSSHNVLLFPRVSGVPRRSLRLIGADGEAQTKCIHIEFIDLHRNMRQEAQKLKEELSEIINRTAHGVS
ncbi:MAG: McrC family protein [Geobacteraceae bacterium]|nr:McrC family protein [Geobacteraceae bacterium]